MLSNRHFGPPSKKPVNPGASKAKNTVQVSAVMVAGREIILVLVDWAAVSGANEINQSFGFLRQLFPGKNVILVARDPLRYGMPAVFFGQPELATLFEGRQIGDFRWTPLEYRN